MKCKNEKKSLTVFRESLSSCPIFQQTCRSFESMKRWWEELSFCMFCQDQSPGEKNVEYKKFEWDADNTTSSNTQLQRQRKIYIKDREKPRKSSASDLSTKRYS